MENVLIEQESQVIWQFKAIEYIVYFAIVVIPLYIGMHHWFPFSAPKIILLNLVSLSMVILYAWGSLRHGTLSFRVTWIHGILLVFLGILTLSSLLGIDIHNSFFGMWSQSIDVLVVYSAGIFACFVGLLIHNNKKILVKILSISFVTSFIVALIAYGGNALISISRHGSTIGNSSYTGAYLLFNICFGIGLFFWYQKRWQKWFIIFAEIIIVLCPIFFNSEVLSSTTTVSHSPLALLGQADAAVLGVVVSLLVIMSFFMMRHHKTLIKKIGFVFFIMILGSVLYGGIALANPESKLHHMYVEHKIGNRFLFWNIARSGFVEHPLLGVGFGNYTYLFQQYFRTEFFEPGYAPEFWTNQPHNVIWEYLSNEGILGLLSFFVLLVGVFAVIYVRREDDDNNHYIIKITIAASLFGYFIQNLFGFDTPVTYFILFFVIGIAMGTHQKQKIIMVPKKWHSDKIVGGTMIATSIACILFFVILPWGESKRWLLVTNPKNFTTGFTQLYGLQEMSPFGGVADSAFLIDKLFATYQKNILQIELATKSSTTLVSVENFIERDLMRQPLNFRAHLTVARVITMQMLVEGLNTDLWERAYNHIQSARELNPQNPEPYFALGQLYIIKKDFIHARLIIRAGIALAPEYGMGYGIAKDLNNVQPNTVFTNYVATMKNQWYYPSLLE